MYIPKDKQYVTCLVCLGTDVCHMPVSLYLTDMLTCIFKVINPVICMKKRHPSSIQRPSNTIKNPNKFLASLNTQLKEKEGHNFFWSTNSWSVFFQEVQNLRKRKICRTCNKKNINTALYTTWTMILGLQLGPVSISSHTLGWSRNVTKHPWRQWLQMPHAKGCGHPCAKAFLPC